MSVATTENIKRKLEQSQQLAAKTVMSSCERQAAVFDTFDWNLLTEELQQDHDLFNRVKELLTVFNLDAKKEEERIVEEFLMDVFSDLLKVLHISQKMRKKLEIKNKGTFQVISDPDKNECSLDVNLHSFQLLVEKIKNMVSSRDQAASSLFSILDKIVHEMFHLWQADNDQDYFDSTADAGFEAEEEALLAAELGDFRDFYPNMAGQAKAAKIHDRHPGEIEAMMLSIMYCKYKRRGLSAKMMVKGLDSLKDWEKLFIRGYRKEVRKLIDTFESRLA